MANCIAAPSGDYKECSICYEPFTPAKIAMTHEGVNGALHEPFHKSCIRAWVKQYSTCPLCRVPLNPRSFFSWTDTLVDTVKKIRGTVLFGGGVQLVYSSSLSNNVLPQGLILAGVGLGIGAAGFVLSGADSTGEDIRAFLRRRYRGEEAVDVEYVAKNPLPLIIGFTAGTAAPYLLFLSPFSPEGIATSLAVNALATGIITYLVE